MEKVELRADAVNLSEEQFFILCSRNKKLRIERDKNLNIIILPPTGAETGNSNSELNREVGNWNKKTRMGYVFDSNTGFTMPNRAMRSPDVSWIPKEKWEKIPKEDRKRFAHICPDFVLDHNTRKVMLSTIRSGEKPERMVDSQAFVRII